VVVGCEIGGGGGGGGFGVGGGWVCGLVFVLFF